MAGYAHRVLSDLVLELLASAVTISLIPRGRADIKFALELGMSVIMDKPIIAIVEPGTQVPGKLLAVADSIVEPATANVTLADQKRIGTADLLRARLRPQSMSSPVC